MDASASPLVVVATLTAVSHHLAVLREHDAVGDLFHRWEQRYGTAEGRGPSFRMPPERVHRLGDAERRRRRAALAEWRGDDDDDEVEQT